MNTRAKGFGIMIFVTAGVYITMKYFLPLVIPFVIAFFIVLLIHPWIERIHQKIRLNRAIITGGLLLLVLTVLGAGLWYIMNKIMMQVRSFYTNIEMYKGHLIEMLNKICESFEKGFGVEARAVKDFMIQNIDKFLARMEENTVPAMMENSFGYLVFLVEVFGFAMIIFISIILLTKDFNDIKEFHKKYFYYQGLRTFGIKAVKTSKNYLKAQLMIMGVISVICIVGLLVLRIPYAILIGIIIGLLDALPVIGTGFIFVPWAIVYLVQGKFLMTAAFTVLYIICSMVREFLEPKLIGEKLGIPSIMVLVSVFVGLRVFGFSGILLGPVSYLLIKELTIYLFKVYNVSFE